MDILNHAATGIAIGSQYDQPILGAIVAVAPDIVDIELIRYRKEKPTTMYRISHSLELCGAILAVGILYGELLPFSLCWISHIALDYISHNKEWGPSSVIFPNLRIPRYKEWEFFNFSWWRGLGANVLFCIAVIL